MYFVWRQIHIVDWIKEDEKCRTIYSSNVIGSVMAEKYNNRGLSVGLLYGNYSVGKNLNQTLFWQRYKL